MLKDNFVLRCYPFIFDGCYTNAIYSFCYNNYLFGYNNYIYSTKNRATHGSSNYFRESYA